jgi:DNA modification methylase
MRVEQVAEGVTLSLGDCLGILPTLDAGSVDSCVCDPPYHLTSIVKRFGAENAAPAKDYTGIKSGATGAYARASAGFMGKKWDGGDIAFRPDVWREVFRVLKPGAHLLSFGGTRTYHRMACAIEDAGFEIRDCLSWNFGSGFPKSHNIGKKLDESEARCSCHSMRDVRDGSSSSTIAGQEVGGDVLQLLVPEQDVCGAVAAVRGEWAGEEVSSQGPHRAGELGMEGRGHVSQAPRQLREREIHPVPAASDFNGAAGRLRDGTPGRDGGMGRTPASPSGVRPSQEPSAAGERPDEPGTMAVQPQPQKRGAWDHCRRCGKPIISDGLGTALKPAMELIVLARKPLSEPTVAANVLRWGTGALNIDGCRVATGDDLNGGRYSDNKIGDDGNAYGSGINLRSKSDYAQPPGRWPANVITDGSDEVVGMFPETGAGQIGGVNDPNGSFGYHGGAGGLNTPGVKDAPGSAARFFYTAKADQDDRLGSKHPTVKPLDLMQYLVRLVTPKGGLVLDCFAGTGTTGEAAWREGMRAVLIERESDYQNDIRRRMALCLAGPAERSRETVRARGQVADAGPLFDTYDPHKDTEGAFTEAYRAIRERKAAGGPGWTPK